MKKLLLIPCVFFVLLYSCTKQKEVPEYTIEQFY